MPITIRPLTESDISAAGEIAHEMHPPYLAEAGMTLWQEVYRTGDDRLCLAAARDDGAVIGCAALWCVSSGKLRLDVMVHPRWQRQGVGGELLGPLLAEAARRDADRVQARARDDRPGALSFLQHRGFVERHQMERFLINPLTTDPSMLRAAIERAEERGVTLTTLAVVQAQDSDCLRKLYELYLAVCPDWPDPDPGSTPSAPPSFAEYLRQIEQPEVVPETVLVARIEDRLVGFCGSLGTAVHPDYRGWGIATTMEARMIEQTRAEGQESLVGQTANPAMRAVYLKLGYERLFSEVRLIRRLGGVSRA
jgi:GNAT superfamily N-acetyltransferase